MRVIDIARIPINHDEGLIGVTPMPPTTAAQLDARKLRTADPRGSGAADEIIFVGAAMLRWVDQRGRYSGHLPYDTECPSMT